MKRSLLILGVACSIASGCAKPCPPPAPQMPVCHQFQAPGFNWASIRRILLVPLENESTYPQATFEFQESLAARMQCSGRFEVVLASHETQCACRDTVRANGRFDEHDLLEIADDYNADAILFATITQYQPYTPPRVGLSLRLISPGNAAVIASVDGLWDSRDRSVAQQASSYASQTLNEGPTLAGGSITLESPAVFRRFACHYAVEALVNPVQYPETTFDPIQSASGIGPGAGPGMGPNPGPGPVTNPQGIQPIPQSVVPFPPPVPPVPMESFVESPSEPPGPGPSLPSLSVDLPLEVPDDTVEVPQPSGAAP